MDSPFLLLAEHDMLVRGCQYSVAEKVKEALANQPEEEHQALWMRINNATYQEIADATGSSKATVWRMVNVRLRRHVYSVLEAATFIG
jgi:DNA-directed RNA polymerase specialized sigma24 family protein